MQQPMSGCVLTTQYFSSLVKKRWDSAPESAKADLAIDIATAREAFRPGDRWIWFIHDLGTALVRTEDADLRALAALSKKEGEWLAIEVDRDDPKKGLAKCVSWQEIESIIAEDQGAKRHLERQPVALMIEGVSRRVAQILNLDFKNVDAIKSQIYESLDGTRRPGAYLLNIDDIVGRISCIDVGKGIGDRIQPGEHLIHIDVLSDVRYGRWIDGGKFSGFH